MLLVWARALLFAHRNRLPLDVYGWQQTRIGPWIRRETRKRLYQRYFRTADGSLHRWYRYAALRLTGRLATIVTDPNLDAPISNEIQFYRFREVPLPPDYFSGFHTDRDLVRAELRRMLTPNIESELVRQTAPDIAVHVRRGDFVPENDPRFEPGGRCCVTPIPFFVGAIQQIRNRCGENLGVTLFSDGRPKELSPILELGNVNVASQNADIVDMLLMSMASFIIPSARSTFSYWSAFLSDATVIRFPYRERVPIRAAETNSFDGTIDEWERARTIP